VTQHYTWRVFGPQGPFLRSTADECLYSGAVRGGKTVAACLKVVTRASVPGAREGIGRKHANTIRPTTLKTLLEGDGVLPPVLPRGSYEHNQQRAEIKIHGCGEIVYFGLDDPLKIGSRSLTGFTGDEALEFEKADYDMLHTRVSLDVPGLKKQLNWVTNPGPPTHWLAEQFGILDESLALPGTEVFRTTTADNPHIGADYIARLQRQMSPTNYRRLVLGQWVGAEGLVLDNWDRAIHMQDREGPWEMTVVGIDDGVADPFVATLVHVDGRGRIHVERSWYAHELTVASKITLVRELIAPHMRTFAVCVVDPSAAQLKVDMIGANLPVMDADNSVIPGIERVRSALGVPLGEIFPRLTLASACASSRESMRTPPPPGGLMRSLIGEIESYEWRRIKGEAREMPEHRASHGPDSLRYALSRLGAIGPVVF